MDNIYGQTAFERNSIVELPEGYAESAGNTLYSWLGSLWRGLHKGDEMIRGLQAVRGIRLAQLYLDILEAARLTDRNGAPVFHRELWHPIVIRISQRDKSQENMLSIGGEATVNPQPEGSIYGEGANLSIGKLANFEKYVSYPVVSNIVWANSTIVDNIVNPGVMMEYGTDFEFRNGSIIFPKENDPLAEGSPFESYDVPGIDPDNPKLSDRECVLWASDVLIDKNYIADHLSYALGANAPSSDVVKRILNAAWSSVASGLTPELIRTLIAAMLNIPVIQNETETVVNISITDEAKIVYTDKGVYKVSPKARLVGGISAGTVLRRGDFLDESVRIYPYLNVLPSEPPFSVPIEHDIPSVILPSSILSAKTERGVYAMWGKTKVRAAKDNPDHLYFDIGGSESDVKAFWEDVWRRFDESGTSMASVLGVVDGSDVEVSPAEFFLKNLVGANTLFVSVDTEQIDDASLMRDPMFFGMLTSVVPSAVRLFLVEHRKVGGVEEIDLGKASAESERMAAAMKGVCDEASISDRVSMRFTRPAPPHVRGKKEEE